MLSRAVGLMHLSPVLRGYNWKWISKCTLHQQAHLPPKVSQPMSITSTQQKSMLTKVRSYLDKDPFIRVSLVFVGAVFAISLLIEAYLKLQKRNKDAKLQSRAIFPPKPSSAVTHRTVMVSHLAQLLKDQENHSLPSAVFVTGPAGSGKTELLRQHAVRFSLCHRGKSTEKKPNVIVLNAKSLDSLELSLLHGLHVLGIPYLHVAELFTSSARANRGVKCQKFLNLLVNEMSSCAQPCLLIIDDVAEKTMPCYESALQLNCDTLQVVAAGCSAWVSNRIKDFQVPVLDLSSGFSEAEALQLFHMSGKATAHQEEKLLQFVRNVSSLPLDIAVFISLLHQSTLRLNSENHIRLCVTNTVNKSAVFQVALDFLLSCNPDYPVSISAVEHHLKNAFYGLTDKDKNTLVSYHQVEKMSWYSTLAHRLASTYSGSDSSMPHNAVPLPTCPLYSHEFSQDGHILSVKLHSKACSELEGMFYDAVIPNLVNTAAHNNQKSNSYDSWKFFSRSKAMSQHNTHLPGVKDGYLGSKAGVLQETEFLKTMNGTKKSDVQGLSYTAYLHAVSHYHRVLEALAHDWLVHASEPGCAGRVIPHVAHLLNQRFQRTDIELLSSSDKARALSLLASFHMKLGNFKLARELHQSAASTFQELNGFNHITVAESLMNLASVYYSTNDMQTAKDCLKRALRVYDHLPPHSSEFHPLYLANILAALGLVHSALEEWTQSREHLEQAMELYRMIPGSSNSVIAASLPHDAANCMTDLGSVYMHLGRLAQSRKLLESACDIHERTGNYYELVRSLSALSTVHSLLGKGDEIAELDRRIATARKLSLHGVPLKPTCDSLFVH